MPPVKSNPRKDRQRKDKLDLAALDAAVAAFVPSPTVALFSDLPLSAPTLEGLSTAFYTKLTPIQLKSLPASLKGKDVLGAATTGSGKTLAFLIPILEILLRKKWGPLDGLGALVISPTRELAVQIFEVLCKIGLKHQFSAGLVIGGKSLKDEQDRLSKMNILVATPGRLLQHMDQTLGFDCDQLQILVLDEADRILDMGFSASLNAIVANLPKTRQTLLFSATQTKSIKDLARLSLKDPEYVAVREVSNITAPLEGTASKVDKKKGAEDESLAATPRNLEQHYMVVELDQKLDLLWSFIKTHLFTKTIVFLSSGKQVRFVYENFRHLRPGVPLLHMHGKQKQSQRLEIYQRFISAKHSILFATDIAARGLDFPSVDWVVQVDCPEDVDTYIHRVGRTARYESKGKALLFLCPSEELGMVKRLESKRVVIAKIKGNSKKLQSVTSQLQSAAFQFPEIKFLAQRAFISYVRSIFLQKDKTVFKLGELPLDLFATSLGLAGAPKIKYGSKVEAEKKKNAVREVEEVKALIGVVGSDGDSDEDDEDDEDQDDEEEDQDDEESEQDGDEDDENVAPTDKTKVRTKYDRMFNRKSQTILSSHYAKLIDRSASPTSGGEDDNDLTAPASKVDDDFITLKRRDHALEEDKLPESSYLSKRKLKMGTSKKAMLSSHDNPTKLVFDDEGAAHAIYELGDEEDFRKDGDARAQREQFVLLEAERLRVADVEDKERAKDKRREKKRKMKEYEEEESAPPRAGGSSDDDDDEDDGYVSPVFDLSEHESDNERTVYRPTAPSSKKKRKTVEVDHGVDLEALALKAMGK